VKCVEQSGAFSRLLQEIAKHPQDYSTPQERVTIDSIEGFHGLALKYHGKKVDFHHSHYACKTSMAICHKEIAIIALFTISVYHSEHWSPVEGGMPVEMGVDVPAPGVMIIMKELTNRQRLHTRRGTSEYRKYRLRKDKDNFTNNMHYTSIEAP